jgi:hypothetical protein
MATDTHARRQADFSNLVLHFTKDGAPYCAGKHPEGVEEIVGVSARDRLVRILQLLNIKATHMPWTDCPAVCFTECTWPSLMRHAERYSSYSVGFQKSLLFGQGGGPAIYMRQDLYWEEEREGGFLPSIKAFLTPFAPEYAPESHKKGGRAIDYSHEREWRVPNDLRFAVEALELITVRCHADIDYIQEKLQKSLPEDKVVVMENYRQIERLWPLHYL